MRHLFSPPCLPAAKCLQFSPFFVSKLHLQRTHCDNRKPFCQLGKIRILRKPTPALITDAKRHGAFQPARKKLANVRLLRGLGKILARQRRSGPEAEPKSLPVRRAQGRL